MGRLQLKPHDHGAQPAWWSTDEWSTPPEFVTALETRYGAFDLDPCCRPETAKGVYYFTREQDGLAQPWWGLVWVNPPYSDPKAWIRKAIAEVQRDPQTRVIMLLPAATDTGWFHDLVLAHGDIELLRGRIKFLGWAGVPVGSPTSGSVLAFFPKGWK